MRNFTRTDWEQALKVLVIGGLSLYFSLNILSGNLTNYINERFAWLSYVAVALLIVMSLAALYALVKGHHRSLRNTDHQQIDLPIILIVALPLLAGTLLPSQPLGAAAVTGSISLNAATGAGISTVTTDPLDRNILDWARLFTESDLPASFDGQQARVIGFVYSEPDFPGEHFMLARFTVSCCVADATPLGLPVRWADLGTLTPGEWVVVEGVFEAGLFRDQKTPILQAETVTPIEQPEHPYLYP